MSIILSTKEQIDRDLKKSVTRLASRGNTRAIELQWRENIEKRFKIRVPPFTGRDIKNLKVIIGEYGDISQFIEKAIGRWQMMRLSKELNLLGTMPTFQEFFTFRHKIYVWLENDKQANQARESLANDRDHVQREEGSSVSTADKNMMLKIAEEVRRKALEGKKVKP